MATLSTRRRKKLELTLEAQLSQLKDSITRLEGENQTLREGMDQLKVKNAILSRENEDLKKRLGGDLQVTGGYDESKTDTTTPPVQTAIPPVQTAIPPPAMLDSAPPEYLDDDDWESTVTGQVVQNIKNSLLDSDKVEPHQKMMVREGTVLVVYFQVTGNTKDVYGYSIIHQDFLNDPRTLQQLDDKDHIQLFFHRPAAKRRALDAAKTVEIAIHNDLTVEHGVTHVDSGDIVLWIRTDKEVDTIKKTLARLLETKLIGQLNSACTNRPECLQTKENVSFISEIIGETYKGVVLPKPKPKQGFSQNRYVPPSTTNTSITYEQYVALIPVPKKFSETVNRESDSKRRKVFSQLFIYWDYLDHGGEAKIELEYFAPSNAIGILTNDGMITTNSTVATYKTREQPIFAPNIYEILKHSRWEPSVALKNVASYLLRMVDYFHQIFLFPYSSENVIEMYLDFFYGFDNGRLKNISGPTPRLFDLMDHMWDVRMGFVYIDELCSILERGLHITTFGEIPEAYTQFAALVQKGALRFQNQDAFPEYTSFQHVNYIAHVKGVLKDVSKEHDQANPLGKNEKARLYGFGSRASLRNYWEAAVVLGLEKEFAFIEPEKNIPRKLTSQLELATGQLEWTEQETILLPRVQDVTNIPRSSYRFVASWRRFVLQTMGEQFGEHMYQLKNSLRQKLGHFNIAKKKKELMKMIILQNGDFSQGRKELLKFINSTLVELTVQAIEARYRMTLDDKKQSFKFKPKEEAVYDQEYFMFNDVVECIKLYHPQWEQDGWRQKNLRYWITGVPGLFKMPEPYTGSNWPVTIHSLSELDWVVVSGVAQGLEDVY